MTGKQICDFIFIGMGVWYLGLLLWLWIDFKNSGEVPPDDKDF